MKTLAVSADTMSVIKNHVDNGRRINAIKALRAETGCGLRDAKYAIDHYMGDVTAEVAGVTIGPFFRIKSFQLECGEGTVEVDMEELKLKFLMQLPEIGIDACGKLLELTSFMQKWQDGGSGN